MQKMSLEVLLALLQLGKADYGAGQETGTGPDIMKTLQTVTNNFHWSVLSVSHDHLFIKNICSEIRVLSEIKLQYTTRETKGNT